tara:strand:- start:122 stop:613 length:492 start_codon:yes stop_codon:yes gene_type:complete
MMTYETTPFRRGLSPDFMAWLSSDTGRHLLGLFDQLQLDVRLRNNYFNAYRAQSSVAKVSWQNRSRIARVEIDRAYLVDTDLIPDDRKIQKFDVSEDFLELYERELPRIRSTVDKHYASPEGGMGSEMCARELETTDIPNRRSSDRELETAAAPRRASHLNRR